MTDLDHQAIQHCRTQLGPDHRMLTNDEIRATHAYKMTCLSLALDGLRQWLVAPFQALAEALAPPEDQ